MARGRINKNELSYFLAKAEQFTLPYCTIEFSAWNELSGTDLGDAIEQLKTAYVDLQYALEDACDEKGLEWDFQKIYQLAPTKVQ